MYPMAKHKRYQEPGPEGSAKDHFEDAIENILGKRPAGDREPKRKDITPKW